MVKLIEYMKIKNHAIDLVDGKQPLYRWIYGLGLAKLETLQTYVESDQANRCSKSSKFFADDIIVLIQKSNWSFYPCVEYWDLNNITIKNQYMLSLITSPQIDLV